MKTIAEMLAELEGRNADRRLSVPGAEYDLMITANHDTPKLIEVVKVLAKSLDWYSDNQAVHIAAVTDKDAGARAREALTKAQEILNGEGLDG